MSRQQFGALLAGIGNGVVACCAIVICVLLVKRELVQAKPSPNSQVFMPQPDWRKYAVGGHKLGAPDADAIAVEFGDYQCPACKMLEERLRVSRQKFGDRLTVLFRHWPLPAHKYARAAAIASECAARQGKFQQMHATLYDLQDSLGIITWSSLAGRAGVERIPDFSRCLTDSSVATVVEADHAAALELKARGTPTLLLNGLRIAGVVSQQTLDSLVGEALKTKAALK